MQYFSCVLDFEHEISITRSSDSAVPAGGVVVLVCTSVSSIPSVQTWVGPDGPVRSGRGVTLIDAADLGRSTLAFHPLRVSHAGLYRCISTVEVAGSIKEASTLVSVKGKLT